jgi:hypothetical protein
MRIRARFLIGAAALALFSLALFEVQDQLHRAQIRQMVDHADRDTADAAKAAENARKSAVEAEGAANAARNLLPGSS